MILSKNISNVYSRGNEIQRVFSYGKLVWEKLSEDYNGVVFTAEETNSTIGLAKLSTNQTLEYRTDYTNWQEMTANTVITLYNIGDRAYIRGELSADNSSSNYTHFTMTGRISASGNINYIWSKNDLDAPLKAYCGFFLFRGAKLTTAPELPATKLGNYCYYWMFRDTLISTAPELPATTLTISCYNGMFEHCLNLTTAPELPATTLTKLCYRAMFYNCFNLTTAPELPAKVLNTQCYELMFYNCNKLNYIKCLATDISATNCTNRWVEQVSETGTFIQTEGVNWPRGVSGIPEGWVVEEELDEDMRGVCFTAERENSTIGLAKLSTNQTLEYRTVGSNWQNMTIDTVITLNYIGDKVYIRGELSADNSESNYTQFTITGLSAQGDCNYIWSKNDLDTPLKKYCGYKMFYGCSLYTTPELPATTLARGCYNNMFGNQRYAYVIPPELPATELAPYCYLGMFAYSPIRQAPELPATTLANGCYQQMFYECGYLTQAPELPATTLANGCYNSMFAHCKITQAPVLPATTLANGCYQQMFYECGYLTQAPELPATTLLPNCYYEMFYGCEKLNYIKCLATDISANRATWNWVSGVSDTGTFVCVKDAQWTQSSSNSGIPYYWTVEYI